jgi:co-chaperonin GroES (HSP10)
MIKVCGHRVLVKPEVEKQTASGIIIALDEHKERAASMYGTVMDVGESAWMDFRTNPWCYEGDRVIFAKYAGRVVEDPEQPDTKFIILNDEDILAVVSHKE